MQTQMVKRKSQRQSPPWEDLDPFVLSMIFGCLSLQDLLFCPPYVCRAWLSATIHTLFRNSILDLRLIDDLDDEKQRSRFTHLLKLAINHCQEDWVTIYFPSNYFFGYFATVYIAERTPNISSLFWPSDVSSRALPIYISLFYWKKLRVFHARLNPEEWFAVLSQVAEFCKNLVELGVHGEVTEKEVLCVVEGFPRLRLLDLSESTLSNKALEILLDQRLQNLKELNILHCLILDDDGNDISDGDYCAVKAWRKQLLEKACKFMNLKKFLHCLERSCQECKDVVSNSDK
ncbi:F-box/LRR-repeat protein At3g48880-like [Mangifera indica]|uniref:F-box/LRR-repeat protein At3g48880-like n=1 Tax=Mangifera indica TaxID=29780 RepID=UPI001CFA40DA|nr:F-box/LRR-repeat protein At3g48880-like [Mangifera indica]